MMGSRKKAVRKSPDIIIESVCDILNYFADRYAELDAPQRLCGALFLEYELNKGNAKAESYLQGLAIGPLGSHPMQSWAIESLRSFKRRNQRARESAARSRFHKIRTQASQMGISFHSEKP